MFNATASQISGPHHQISLVAKGGGPFYNTQDIFGDGFYSAGGSALGGGYEWESQGPASVYRVRCYGSARSFGNPYLRVKMKFKLNGSFSGYEWLLDVPLGSSFTYMANPHGFSVFDPNNDNYFLQNTSIFAMAPKIPSGWTAPYCVFVVGNKCFRTSTSNWNRCEVALDGGPVKWDDGAYPCPVLLRAPNNAVLTLAGTPFAQGPFVEMGRNRNGVRTVVGKFWDILSYNDYIAPGGGLQIGADFYQVLSSQLGTGNKTKSTLLWRYSA